MPMSISEKPKIKKKIRYAEYYDMTVELDKLYADSQMGKSFTNLMEIIRSEENIKMAYRSIKSNTGSKTSGVDGLTIADLKNIPIEKFIDIVRRKLARYKSKPVRRVEIPKANGKKRPLGIPTIWDRIIQQCILQVLEPICEAKFHERNNGFRPNRSVENAIAQCYRMIQKQGLHYVVDIDIKGFFDNVSHSKLKKQMWTLGIRDKQLICIIGEMLKAPIVMPNGDVEYPTRGTPQGGILSPLLSNVVLNELDWWVASQWENVPTKHQYAISINSNGGISNGAKYNALKKHSNLKEMYIVRYADDFKIFCRSYKDAQKTFVAIKQWIEDRLKLQISGEKSKVINLRRHYSEFLGFKMKAVKKANRYVVKSHMRDKAVENEKKNLRNAVNELKSPRDKIEEYKLIQKYNSIVWGIHNYYQIATNINLDCKKIAYSINRHMKSSLGKRLKKQGKNLCDYIEKKYGKSKQIRYIHDFAISPIGYVKAKNPMYKKRTTNKYTAEGRNEIHRSLQINLPILYRLMRNLEVGRSIEYSDNRISKYSAQQGKCAITGKVLEYEEIHCHHKIPVKLGGTDNYNNLIIVHSDIHKLLHATSEEVIKKYLDDTKPDEKMLIKINELRKKLQLESI